MARLPMRKIREALRLRASGLTTREVGTASAMAERRSVSMSAGLRVRVYRGRCPMI